MTTGSETSPNEPAGGETPAERWSALEALVARSAETGILEIAHALLREAILQGASALHLEPRRSGGVVRYRVAGELSAALTLPPELLHPVTARLKLMANLD